MSWKEAPSKESKTHKIKTACGNLYVTIAQDKYIFLKLGLPGGCAASQLETIAKLATKTLELGFTLSELAEKLEGITCHVHAEETPSCSHALSLMIRKHLNENSSKL